MSGSTSWEILPEEKTTAGLAYLLGLIPALIIWLVKRRESEYVSFHAVQAAFYDGLLMLVAVVFFGMQFFQFFFWMIATTFGANYLMDMIESGNPLILILIALILMLIGMGWMSIMILVLLSLSLIDLAAAFSAFTGKDFRYPVFGALADKFSHSV